MAFKKRGGSCSTSLRIAATLSRYFSSDFITSRYFLESPSGEELRKVLKEIEFRYEGDDAFDDTFFCKDALAKGYKIYADTNVQCEHIIMEGLWSWNDIKKKGEM